VQLSAVVVLKRKEDKRKDLKMNEPCRLKIPLLSVDSGSAGSKLRSDGKSMKKSSNLQWRYILTDINYLFRRYKFEFKRATFSGH